MSQATQTLQTTSLTTPQTMLLATPQTPPQATKHLDKQHIIRGWVVNDSVDPLVVERAEGMYFWDDQGKRYLEFSSGLVNLNTGHQHPKVVAAIKEQAERLCFIHPGFATSARAEAAAAIAERTPGDLNHIFFTTSGADANENAIKFARFYTGRQKILAKYRGYHGATHGALALTGDARRAPAEPVMPGVVHVPDPYCYRCPFKLEHPSCDVHCASHIEQVIEWEGPHAIAAIFLESMAGSGGGYYETPPGYLERVREICDTYGILLVCDEVMVGFGRTGKWFTVEHSGVVPDMITMAKGLTSGYVPLGAVAVSERMWEKLGKETLWAGLTYNGHPLACAAAKATLEVYEDEQLIENSERLGKVLQTRLQAMQEKYEVVGDVRNLGLFGALELVQDRGSKQPLAKDIASSLKSRLMAKGLSTLVKGHVIFVGPPLIINEEQLLAGMDIIEDLVRDVNNHVYTDR